MGPSCAVDAKKSRKTDQTSIPGASRQGADLSHAENVSSRATRSSACPKYQISTLPAKNFVLAKYPPHGPNRLLRGIQLHKSAHNLQSSNNDVAVHLPRGPLCLGRYAFIS
jgi:hypothetical protein